MKRILAIYIERLSWWLEDVAAKIDLDAAEEYAKEQDALGRVPLVDQ